jgi:hypothetical protein
LSTTTIACIVITIAMNEKANVERTIAETPAASTNEQAKRQNAHAFNEQTNYLPTARVIAVGQRV